MCTASCACQGAFRGRLLLWSRPTGEIAISRASRGTSLPCAPSRRVVRCCRVSRTATVRPSASIRVFSWRHPAAALCEWPPWLAFGSARRPLGAVWWLRVSTTFCDGLSALWRASPCTMLFCSRAGAPRSCVCRHEFMSSASRLHPGFWLPSSRQLARCCVARSIRVPSWRFWRMPLRR